MGVVLMALAVWLFWRDRRRRRGAAPVPLVTTQQQRESVQLSADLEDGAPMVVQRTPDTSRTKSRSQQTSDNTVVMTVVHQVCVVGSL